MTRVKFLFDNEFTWRSYYESGILSKLEECFEIHYLMINLKNKFEIQNAEYIKLNKFLSFFLTLNSFSYWTKKRLLSNSFKIRILSIIMGRRLFFEKKYKPGQSNRSLSAFVGIMAGYANIEVPDIILKSISTKIKHNLLSDKSNIVVYPTIGGPLCLADLVSLLTKTIGIKTIVCIENWDNIFSKAVFHKKPNKLLVWGPQSKTFASEIHEMNDDNIILSGSPRINYTKNRIKQFSVKNKKSILFAGGSQNINHDLFWLKKVNEVFSHQYIIKYLPHPKNFNHKKHLFILGKLENIEIIIPEVVQQHTKDYPPLESYTALYDSIDIVISPLSTISLEALIYNKLSVGIDFQEYIKLNKRKKYWWATEVFEHYFLLQKCANFHLIRETQELTSLKNLLIKNDYDPNLDLIYSSKNFSETLENTILEIAETQN